MQISAGEFKSKCLKLMDNVDRTHEPVLITKHGKPIAMMIPVPQKPKQTMFGYMVGTATVSGNIVESIDTNWEAED